MEPSRFDVPQDALYDEEFRKLLTAREEEFLVLRLGTRLSWRLIAIELGITPRTIYDYARRVSEKWTHYQNKGVSA